MMWFLIFAMVFGGLMALGGSSRARTYNENEYDYDHGDHDCGGCDE